MRRRRAPKAPKAPRAPRRGPPSALSTGFTLIELLVVIGIIVILVSIVVSAINPGKQLGDARNAQRRTNVQTIVDAVHQFALDHDRLPIGITLVEQEICASGPDPCAVGIDLDVLTGAYLATMPVDPQAGVESPSTKYTIVQTAGGRITVRAPLAENGQVIGVTR